MLALSWDTVRLFLHVLAATIWVGGQLTLAFLVPPLRRLGAELPRAAARAFNRVAWPAFTVLIITGVWNSYAVRGAVHGEYQVTLWVKIAVVAVSGLTAWLHSRAKSPAGLAVFGALTGVSALAALFLGIMLGNAALFRGQFGEGVAQGGPGGNAEFREHLVEVRGDRSRGQEEAGSDLLVGVARRCELGDLALLRGEGGKAGVGFGEGKAGGAQFLARRSDVAVGTPAVASGCGDVRKRVAALCTLWDCLPPMEELGEICDPVAEPAAPPAAPAGQRDEVRRRTWGFWQWPALLVIAAVAAVADAWDMTSDGLEVYYAAGVRSMAGSWHAFLYDSFDPSRGITLDKLPGPFWVQALSVRAFGMSVWAMVLPQVVWSVLTVVVLFVAVRRVAGPVTGLAAAAILAISPVTILSAHGNLGDPLFVLLTVLAADAALRAVRGRGWWLVLAAVWVGLAFQEKMTEAWLLAAVLAAVYLLAGPAGLQRRLARLAVAAPVLAVVSLAWLVFVTLTPVRDRPYADGSADNSVFAQVFNYNGIARFGVHPSYGLGYLTHPSAAAIAYAQETKAVFVSVGSQTRPGWDRLLSAPLAQVTGWFLVPALVVAVACVVAVIRARRRKEAEQEHAPVLVWGLWLIVVTVVFSVSDEVQSYYFGILSPAIAALCALGAKAALDRFAALRWRLFFTTGVTGTALWSAVVLFEAGPAWHGVAFGIGAAALVTGAAVIGLTAAGRPRRRVWLAMGRISLALTMAAGLAGPLIADGWLLTHRAGPFDVPLTQGGTFAQSSPSMIAARRAHPGYGGTILPETSAATWRQFQTLGREYNHAIPAGKWLAVYSSAAASNYVFAGVQRVLPIGGFTGSAPTPTVGQLTEMLSRHQIALAIIPGPADLRYNDPRVQAIVKHCAQVFGFGDTTARAQSYDCQDA